MKKTVATQERIKIITEAVNKNCCEENRLAVGCFVMSVNEILPEDIKKAFGLKKLEDVITYQMEFYKKLSNENQRVIEVRDGYTNKTIFTGGYTPDGEDIETSVRMERKLVENYINRYLK